MRAIDTEGLDEQIRCEMCRNPIHTDRGCDGNCKYDEKLYERIMQILSERITPLPSAQPERPSGEWTEKEVIQFDDLEAKDIITEWQSAKCNVCGKYHTTPYMYYFDDYEYCPNCGANMRGKQDE